MLSLINSTVVDTSIKEELGEQAIQGLLDRQIETKINWNLIKKLGLIGLDEISLRKGHGKFVTLVTSRVNNEISILAVLPGREKVIIQAFLAEIPKKLHKTIIAFCTDLYEGFINAVKSIFKKKIPVIADRFHVAKLYRKSLITLRKQELKRLRKKLSEEKYRELKPAIALFCCQQALIEAEDKEIIEPLFKASPLLKAAYQFCIELTGIYNSHITPKEAHGKLNQWIVNVENSQLICFNSFIGTLKKYQNEIENYFMGRQSSGFVEGINNKVKVLKRRCYGIYNLAHFFQRLWLDFSGYAFFGKKPMTV